MIEGDDERRNPRSSTTDVFSILRDGNKGPTSNDIGIQDDDNNNEHDNTAEKFGSHLFMIG